MTPRRIALVAHRFASPTPTGIGHYYVELTRALAQVADAARYRFVAASLAERDEATWVPAGVERRFVPGPRKAVGLAWGLLGRPHIDAALGRPHVVHALHAFNAVPTRAPLVVTVHDVAPLRLPEWYPRMERWLHRRALTHAREHARVVITVSEFVAAQIAEHGGIERARLRVVPPGVGEAFRRVADADVDGACARFGLERGRYLVAVSAVIPRKNLSVVFRAIAALPTATLGPVALLVAGPRGLGADAVEAETRALGIADRVRFAGHVSGDLPALVAGALALVHPSRDESFGFPPLEAMAAGVPALAAAAGAMPAVSGPGAALLEPEDADAWAREITAVAENSEHRATLVAAGDRHQRAYTWSDTAAKTIAVYEEIMGSP